MIDGEGGANPDPDGDAPDGDLESGGDSASGGDPDLDGGRDRDRDGGGRARNARPRDELGRPLSRGAFAADAVVGAPLAPSGQLSPADALVEAQRLLDNGYAFRAHEVLEESWKAAPEVERELWRGLAQLAVGVTHAQRGNAVGAMRLLRRGGDRVAGYAADVPYGVDAAGLPAWAQALAARIERDGLDGLTRADLTPHLRTPSS